LIVALEVDAREDLRSLSRWLRAQGVPHRIFEASGRLRLAVGERRFVQIVQDAYRAQAEGALPELPAGGAPLPASESLRDLLGRQVRQAPAAAGLVALTLCFFPATWTLVPDELPPALRWLLIVPVLQVDEYIQFTSLATALSLGEVWRLWTPVLLHFGVLHLVFNLLWLWEFGRRLEAAHGSVRLLQTVLVLAPISNGVQYLLVDSPIFGGMSGVVYGLLGYLIVAARRDPHPALQLRAGLVIALLVLLVLFSTGVTEPFGLHVANAAHWGGFLAGVLWAALRVRRPSGPGRDDPGGAAAD
jgi:GlpG protein